VLALIVDRGSLAGGRLLAISQERAGGLHPVPVGVGAQMAALVLIEEIPFFMPWRIVSTFFKCGY